MTLVTFLGWRDTTESDICFPLSPCPEETKSPLSFCLLINVLFFTSFPVIQLCSSLKWWVFQLVGHRKIESFPVSKPLFPSFPTSQEGPSDCLFLVPHWPYSKLYEIHAPGVQTFFLMVWCYVTWKGLWENVPTDFITDFIMIVLCACLGCEYCYWFPDFSQMELVHVLLKQYPQREEGSGLHITPSC